MALAGVIAIAAAVFTTTVATGSSAYAQEKKEKDKAKQKDQEDNGKDKDKATDKAETDEDGNDKDAVKFATIDKPAPDFTLTDIDGKEHTLSEYKGKYVVLEWYNPQCPYVKKQHEDGPLDTAGNEYTKDKKKDVVWLAINSGGPGQQGSGLDRNIDYRKTYGIEYPILLDESGDVGRLYKARTTPHMYVIDTKGVLRYMGAIDNAPLGRVSNRDKELVNYVEQAIEELKADKKVSVTTTRPYGCGVKYQTGRDGQGQGRGFGQGGGRRGGGGGGGN
ncbi:MAG: thioredoxin family protein [Planctomycetes bacterium]|nr:thioredoxin family protein [Planctomycetota bacterium]NOG55867.1 redoxin domain-containing protein [Planctomycetota bacterium]